MSNLEGFPLTEDAMDAAEGMLTLAGLVIFIFLKNLL